MICNKCNHNNKPGANFCAKCGAVLDNNTNINSNRDKISQDNYKNEFKNVYKNPNYQNKMDFSQIVKIGAGILIVVLIVFIAKYFIGGNNKDSENSEPDSYSSSIADNNLEEEESTTNNLENDQNLDSNNNQNQQDYIIPDSSDKILTYSDIEGLSKQEIRYAKNEIYARNGRRFDSQELQAYFNSKSWYNGVIDPEDFNEETMLSDIEYKNVIFLSEREHSM